MDIGSMLVQPICLHGEERPSVSLDISMFVRGMRRIQFGKMTEVLRQIVEFEDGAIVTGGDT